MDPGALQSVSGGGVEPFRSTLPGSLMTSVCVGVESEREACDTCHRAVRTPTRDTLGSVITMSAKAQETGWYGQVRCGTRWHDDPTKTASDLHGRARNGSQRHR